jgi:hypothetical protein
MSSRTSKRAKLSLAPDSPGSPAANSDDDAGNDSDVENAFSFTQEAPEASQSMADIEITQKETDNFTVLGAAERQKLVSDMLRYFTLKGFQRQYVVKKHATDAVMKDYVGKKIAAAVFKEALTKLKDLFGYVLLGVPGYMKNALPNKYKDRYYVVNALQADAEHCVALHDRYDAATQGLLMVVLCIVYNKGAVRGDLRGGFRWIAEEMLYSKLHDVDPVISAKEKGGRKENVICEGMVADVPTMIAQFCDQDYLLKEKLKVDDDSR